MLIFFVCILVDLSQGFCYSGLTLEAGGLDRLTKCASPPDMFLLYFSIKWFNNFPFYVIRSWSCGLLWLD